VASKASKDEPDINLLASKSGWSWRKCISCSTAQKLHFLSFREDQLAAFLIKISSQLLTIVLSWF
jgi:hypothetical protein